MPHPTLDHPTIVENSFGLDHNAIRGLASYAARHSNALGVFIEIHSAADPVQAPVVTVRAANANGTLGEREVIS